MRHKEAWTKAIQQQAADRYGIAHYNTVSGIPSGAPPTTDATAASPETAGLPIVDPPTAPRVTLGTDIGPSTTPRPPRSGAPTYLIPHALEPHASIAATSRDRTSTGHNGDGLDDTLESAFTDQVLEYYYNPRRSEPYTDPGSPWHSQYLVTEFQSQWIQQQLENSPDESDQVAAPPTPIGNETDHQQSTLPAIYNLGYEEPIEDYEEEYELPVHEATQRTVRFASEAFFISPSDPVLPTTEDNIYTDTFREQQQPEYVYEAPPSSSEGSPEPQLEIPETNMQDTWELPDPAEAELDDLPFNLLNIDDEDVWLRTLNLLDANPVAEPEDDAEIEEELKSSNTSTGSICQIFR